MFDSNKKIVYQDTLDEYHKRISALIGTGGSQISTIPTASEDYENVIYQYIGTTDSTYTNGYFYKCIEDPENEGEYIWVNIPTQETQSGGTGGGHTILDPEDTEMTQRANLKFGGDFEVSDDSTNDVTEIAPHELTNEDMAEIMSTLPTPVNNRLPVLFDEQGVERQVGWYVNSSGLRKPVYEKTIIDTMPAYSSGSESQKEITVSSDIDKVLNIEAFCITSQYIQYLNGRIYGSDAHADIAFNTSTYKLDIHSNASFMSEAPVYITFKYTKTTDTFQ